MKRSVGISDLAIGQGPAKWRKSLDFGCEDLGDGDVDSASGLGEEKEDHETKISRWKLQEKQQNKSVSSVDLDQLESWHKELSAADFSVSI